MLICRPFQPAPALSPRSLNRPAASLSSSRFAHTCGKSLNYLWRSSMLLSLAGSIALLAASSAGHAETPRATSPSVVCPENSSPQWICGVKRAEDLVRLGGHVLASSIVVPGEIL